MKKQIVIALTAILPIFGSFAQGVEKGQGRWKSMTPDQKASSNANWMAKRLTLSEDQKTQVKAANVEFYTATKSAKDKYKSDSLKTQRKAALKLANDNREAKLKTILTAEQYTKLEQIRKERKEKKKSNGKSKPSGKGKSKTEPKAKPETTGDDDGGEGDDLEDSDSGTK